MKKKIALITGITGQDGSYLSELLLEKDYEVHGIIRRASSFNTGRIDHIFNELKLYHGDVSDPILIDKLIKQIKPDEVYNLAAQSHVQVSFENPYYTNYVNNFGTLIILESIKNNNLANHTKFYQACSSEMYGSVVEIPQTETTPFNPVSPYACSKVFSYYLTRTYRQAYKIFASNGILFNHESPRRGETFVTRKITRAASRIKVGLQNKLRLGNLNTRRDWGFAGDYVRAMWLILQHHVPDDFVIGTGETHSVEEFLNLAFKYFDLDYKDYIIIDPEYFRPSDVSILLSNPIKAKNVLGWSTTIKFDELIKLMCQHDYNLALQEKKLVA